MRQQGFTLLEVLLAVTVLGVVTAMLSISISGTLRVVDATEQQEEIYYQGQIALRRITEDLAGALSSKDAIFTGKKEELDGERADTLVFASMAHLVFNPEKQKQGMARIRYHLQADAEDARKLKLLRSDTLLLPGIDYKKINAEDSPFLLADNLRSVQFSYVSRQGQESDRWEGREKAGEKAEALPLPASVFCTLEFWLDPEKNVSQAFSTGVLLPSGLITAEIQGEK